MNRFSSKDNVKRIDIGDGDWVEVPAIMSYAQAEELQEKAAQPAKAVASLVVRWNLKDASGDDVEVSEESVRLLDIKVVNMIMASVKETIGLPKE